MQLADISWEASACWPRATAFPLPAFAQAKPKVVVIGGGPGGATAAKYIAKDGGIEVTLVEPARQFTTCFHSNLYLGGFRSLRDRSPIPMTRCVKAYGIKHARQMAAAIDRDKKTVRLANGAALPYDRLVLSPGIDLKFDSVPGYSEEAERSSCRTPGRPARRRSCCAAARRAPDGATIVMIAPPNPYRCPPGPYERVSMMAHVLKAKGHKKSRIIVLDPKENFSKQALFVEGWQKHYPGMVEWQDPKMHGGVKSVDAKTMTVETDLAEYKAAPDQRDPGADGRQDRARCGACQRRPASARSIPRT